MFILEVYVNPDPKHVSKSSQKPNHVTGQMNKHADCILLVVEKNKNSNLYNGMKL